LFEVKQTDLAARIGKLSTKHGRVETPAFVPVIHPVRQTISPNELKKMGFDLVITNAYITKKKYGENADNIHKIINFDGAVMTDSGGYQVLEYGDIDANPKEIALFEETIDSDIAIPLDKPTGFKLDRETAESYVNQTLKAAEETVDIINGSKTIWAGPIQGGEHLDLVSSSAKKLDILGYNMFALGSPTEVMESYEFSLLARMIIAAKSSIPASKPLHLFGAGHPLTIPLAVALGCDTFDSASYMLYARDNRYILPSGTVKLQDLQYLPCSCGICSRYTAKELTGLEDETRFVELARHNLHAIKTEVDYVKQSIVDGRLWEYAMQKAMSHPKLLESVRVLVEASDYLEDGTPLYKEKALFLFSPLDQYRPELIRFRRMVQQNVRTNKDTLVLLQEPNEHPLYVSGQYNQLRKQLDSDNVQLAYYSPFLGVVPEEVSDIFPAAHHVSARTKFRTDEFPTFADSITSYIKNNGFKRVIIVADDFVKGVLDQVKIKLVVLQEHAKIEEIASAVNQR
jgi:7-cyano-7-deazaguanine tRNA-ribosyltransferase